MNQKQPLERLIEKIQPIDDVIRSLCPHLKITDASLNNSTDSDEIYKLYRAWMDANEPVYLDFKHAQFAFLAKKTDINRFVGFCTLRDYSPPGGRFGIACLTHPKFEGQHIATALVTYAVDFAKSHPGIDVLYGHTRPGSATAKISERLGFEIRHRFEQLGGIRVTYYLDTH